jgi:hypothetical protein
VSGVTCDNCNGGFNPHLIVSSYLISKGSYPLGLPVGVRDADERFTAFNLYPNPSNGQFFIGLEQDIQKADIVVYDHTGRSVKKALHFNPGTRIEMNLSHLARGMYFVTLTTEKGVGTKALVVQ